MGYSAKEVGGTLLIVGEDNRTYEEARSITSNYLIITPDEDTPKPTSTEEKKKKKLFRLSNCYSR